MYPPTRSRGRMQLLMPSTDPSCPSWTLYESTLKLSDVCVIHSVWKLQQERCLRGLVTVWRGRQESRKRRKKKVIVATAPLPSNTHSHCRTFPHTRADSSHTDTLLTTCVLWFIHSCYLHFRRLTGAKSIWSRRPTFSNRANAYWCSHIKQKTSSSITDYFRPWRFQSQQMKKLPESRSF